MPLMLTELALLVCQLSVADAPFATELGCAVIVELGRPLLLEMFCLVIDPPPQPKKKVRPEMKDTNANNRRNPRTDTPSW